MRLRLDQTDLSILKALQDDGRISNADLARSIGLSPPSTLQRVRKLEEAGYVNAYRAELNAPLLGYSLMAVAMISLSLHQEQPIEQFREAVKGVPEVLQCLQVSGEFDFLLTIVAQDMEDYQRIVSQKLSSIKAVGRISSSFVMDVTKKTERLPI